MTAIATIVYPSLISRACAALDESPVFKEVPDGYIRVILRIIKKINLKRLNSPIVASRAKIAEESGKSVETVHRVVRWLELRGLIKREQRARPELRGSSSPLIPTEKLLDTLLLSEQAKAGINDKYLSTTSDSQLPNQSSSRPIRQDGKFERIGKVMLPADLAWLVKEQRLHCSGVLQLMKLASQSQQRLSTVVAATRKYLEGLEGRALYAYLRTLLNKGQDFGQRATEQARSTAEFEEREYLKRKAEALAGQTFKSRDDKLVVMVDSSGMLIELKDGRRFARPFCKRFIEAIEAGRLRAVQGVYI